MKIPDFIIDWIAWRKYEFDTAWSYGAYVFQFLSFETFAMVFCDKFGIIGLPAIFIYVIMPPIAMIALVCFGRGLINIKVQEKYAQICQNMNPDWKQFMKEKEEARK